MRLRFATLLACTVALSLGTAGLFGQERAPYSAIVVFGTSLSDSGNAFALRGGTNTPPDYLLDPLLIPSAPYARGGHHFSNGATWVEQFARSLRLAGTVRPAFAADSLKATNYAVGAARAYDDGATSISRTRCRRSWPIMLAAFHRTRSTSSKWAATTSVMPSWLIRQAVRPPHRWSCRNPSRLLRTTSRCCTRLAPGTFSFGFRRTWD